MTSTDIACVPDREAVDKRILMMDDKVTVCRATIDETLLGIRLIGYDIEEEGLEVHLAKLKHEFDKYEGPTAEEREEQKWQLASLRRQLEHQRKELVELLATKNEDEVLVLRQAEDIVAKLLAGTDAVAQAEVARLPEGAGEAERAEVEERLALRRGLLHEVRDAVAAGLEQKLELHPIRLKSRNLYYLLSEDKAVMVRHAEAEDSDAPKRKPHTGEEQSEPRLVMHVAVVPITYDEQQRIVVQSDAADSILVTQPFASASGAVEGGIVYRGPLSQHCEPECVAVEGALEAVQLGTATYPDGSTYCGQWRRGQRQGDDATMVFVNGDRYTGSFSRNAMTGSGRMQYADGDVYEGGFRRGRRNGQGVYQCTADKDGSCYDGEWVDGVRQGHGTCVYPDEGYRYTGEWHGDNRCGQGTLAALDERGYYEGPWNADNKHGDGAVHFTVNGVRYDGMWKKGVRRGQASAFTVENKEAAEQYAQLEAAEATAAIEARRYR